MAESSLKTQKVQQVCMKIREQLFRNGATGLARVAQCFRHADFNGNKKLDKEEFAEALSFVSLFLSTQDTSTLFNHFDRDGDGNINYDELLLGIQLPLNGCRLAMVQQAFKKMDKDGSQVIDLEDVKGVYDASKHPDVIEGKKTAQQVTTTFLKGFERTKVKDGKVTFKEFAGYYQDLGASIPSDEYFCAMMQSCWDISPAVTAAKGAGSIDKWVAMLKTKVQQKTKTGQRLSLTLKNIFYFFDGDESGAITKDEFGQAMVRLGIHLKPEDMETFFIYFAGKDRRIVTKEFIDKMQLDD